MRFQVRAFAIALMSLLALNAFTSARGQEKELSLLPPGPGREIFVDRCTFCHSIAGIGVFKQTPEYWKTLVEDMSEKAGWGKTDPDIKVVLDYLIASFGESEDAANKPAAGASAVPSAADLMPQGPGREIVLERCTLCHSLLNIVGAGKQTAAYWRETVQDMAREGDWDPKDPDIKKITDYLVGAFGKPDEPAAK